MLLRELKQGCPFLYKANGELHMREEDRVVIVLTGKHQGEADLFPNENATVYPVTITMTYKV